MAKTLIAYFSRKGANYVNGSIVNLTVGNTEAAAKMAQEVVFIKNILLGTEIIAIDNQASRFCLYRTQM